MALGDELREYTLEELELIRARRDCLFPLSQMSGEDIETVDAWRKLWAKNRDELLAMQKDAAKRGDRETAKFLKGEAAEAMKLYRGACLVLPWIMCDPPGDCNLVSVREWPAELIPYARIAMLMAI